MNTNAVVIVASLLLAQVGFENPAAKPVAISPIAWWQNSPNVTKITPENPDRKIVEAEIQTVISWYKKPAYEPPYMAEPMQLETPTLSRLFPKYRFYLIAWHIAVANTPEGRMVSVPGGLYFTLVVPAKGEPIKLRSLGNQEDFGILLNRNGVKLKSADDALLIWTAFNDATQKRWHGQRTHRQVSPTEWALGEVRWENFKSWYQITLDANQIVISSKLMSEEVKTETLQK